MISMRQSGAAVVYLLLLLLFIMTMQTSNSLKVAVIGGGACGLAAARVLSRSGLNDIVVLEQDPHETGGVWNYHSQKEDTQMTKPMYKNLRTNLPREIMQFREKPWNAKNRGPGGDRSYVTHHDVLEYLNQYKKEFNLDQYIRYGCEVKHLVVLDNENDNDGDWPRIRLTWQHQTEQLDDIFDAVCICNGHYGVPSRPHVEGLSSFFRGTKIMHSIEYDDPTQYQGQTVLCIGARASGSDLTREISQYAKHVYLSDSTATNVESWNNVTRVPKTLRVNQDGSFQFDCGCSLQPADIDTVIFCSGYDYSFPFINDKNSNLELSAKDRRVMPLYKQLWHARHPSVAFLGLPHSVVPFPLFELQAEAVVNQLLKKQTDLPPLQERLQEAQRDATSGGYTQQGRIQDTHYLGSGQWDYCRDMAKLAGIYDGQIENYIATNQAIYDYASQERKSLFPGGPDTYRETCYQRDDENQSFRVVARAGNGVKTASTSSSRG